MSKIFEILWYCLLAWFLWKGAEDIKKDFAEFKKDFAHLKKQTDEIASIIKNKNGRARK